ncbi:MULTISPECIES: HupE/UreJ family protein [Sphingosinicellaceae]|uniref:HupE/UreJ family protein n=1 Tax=Sphingosinicellaceae TaxID=2820280 RepID=UPI001D01F24E|nr:MULTISPECIES: HupE/UreJ family protein [Polymorphobacter]
MISADPGQAGDRDAAARSYGQWRGRTHRSAILPLLIATAMLFAAPAAAHTGTGLAGGFQSGFLHPLSGFDHLLAMVSVGLWGAFLGRPLIVVLPVIFPTVMAIGGVMGIAGVPMPPVEIGIALSVLVLGAMIAGAVRAPVWLASLIVAIFAIFHGYAHGKELPSAADPVGYSAGFVLATGMLHVVGISLGLINDRPGGAIVTRSMGGLVMLAGVWFLWTALAK